MIRSSKPSLATYQVQGHPEQHYISSTKTKKNKSKDQNKKQKQQTKIIKHF